MTSPFSNLETIIEENSPPKEEIRSSIKTFFNKLTGQDEDCLEDDCDELLSPCCQAKLHTIFGTLPLEVKCEKCESIYKLSDLVKEIL